MGKPWSISELRRARELRAGGMAVVAIARKLRRPYAGVVRLLAQAQQHDADVFGKGLLAAQQQGTKVQMSTEYFRVVGTGINDFAVGMHYPRGGIVPVERMQSGNIPAMLANGSIRRCVGAPPPGLPKARPITAPEPAKPLPPVTVVVIDDADPVVAVRRMLEHLVAQGIDRARGAEMLQRDVRANEICMRAIRVDAERPRQVVEDGMLMRTGIGTNRRIVRALHEL